MSYEVLPLIRDLTDPHSAGLPPPDGEILADHIHDTDAGGNCRYVGCDFNADIDYVERVTRGEDVYGDVPDIDPSVCYADRGCLCRCDEEDR